VLDLGAVMLVLGVLVMVAFPMWASSMAEARTRVCAGNLGAVGRAVAMYADENEDRLPGNQHSPPSWVQGLAGYVNTNVYRCPDEVVGERRGVTIALNDFLTPKPYGARWMDFSKRSMVPSAAESLMFAEADEEYRAYDHFHFADGEENGYGAEAFSEQVDVERHGVVRGVGSGMAIYLFVEGRVEGLEWRSAVKGKLGGQGSRFVDPAGGVQGPKIVMGRKR
jgi:type II secretory pathway pseudopilin PulG